MARKKRLLFACHHGDHAAYLRRLLPYFKKRGYTAAIKRAGKDYRPLLSVRQQDLLFIWNGAKKAQEAVVNQLREMYAGRLVFCEMGWFPGCSLVRTGKTVYFDRSGINALSEIRRFQLPRQLNRGQKKQLANWFAGVGIPRQAPGSSGYYTLVPLQLARDTNIVENSPHFKSMQPLIDHVEKVLDPPIIFKRHPRDGQEYHTSRRGNRVVYVGDLYKMLIRAGQVVGINSTVLLEALTFRKKVAALGVGLFTGQKVIHECHADPRGLALLGQYTPDWERIDSFLFELVMRRQIWLASPEASLRRNRVLQELLKWGLCDGLVTV